MQKGSASPARTLEGWGRTSRKKTPTLQPENRDELIAGVAATSGPMLVHAAGRSYGDQAIPTGGVAVSTLGLDRILSFDETRATAVVEAGVTFEQLLEHFLPKGFMAAVSPGTSFATIGGAIANDVHGKNHDLRGSFCDHLEWFELLTPDGSMHRVSQESDGELFRATVAGCGMTGIILSACIRLKAAPGNCVNLVERRVRDLEDFFTQIENQRARSEYSIGWIDALKKGQGMGRGILETAELAEQSLPPRGKSSWTVPFSLPSFTLNAMTVRAFNAVYFRHVPAEPRSRLLHINKFLYPLDAIKRWNRIYGRTGFYQFQCVTPDNTSFDAIRKMLEVLSQSGLGSFLAVLKSLGGSGQGLLGFPMRGYTLALDIPIRKRTEGVLRQLTDLTLEAGGRVYLAKDACLTADAFRKMYPDYPQFEAVLRRVDPDHRLRSKMSERLQWRTGS